MRTPSQNARFSLLLLITLLISCAPFQDSPFSDVLLREEREFNGQSLARLENVDIEADGKIRIAVFADPHQNYKDLDRVILWGRSLVAMVMPREQTMRVY